MERLRELESAYRSLPFSHGYWRDLQATIPLDRFRDNFYLGLQTTRATYDHVRGVDREGWIERLGEDRAFGAQPSEFDGRLVSRDLLDSVLELRFARDAIGPSLEHAKILDVGAGYGRLAHRITALWPEARVFCTDAVPVSTRVCEIYLAHRGASRAETVPAHELHKVPTIDVALNVHSWSECSLQAIEFWLDLIDARGARYLMIVPHRGASSGYLRSDDGHNYWPSVERRGFRCIREQAKYPPGVEGSEPTSYFMFERTNMDMHGVMDAEILRWGTHAPLLAVAVAVASPGLPILELGAGRFSTPTLSAMCAATGRRLVSADSDLVWLDALRRAAMGEHAFEHVTEWDSAIDRFAGESWGAVLVDHWPQDRRGRDLARLAERAELLVLHDSQDERCGYDLDPKSWLYLQHDERFEPRTTLVSRLRSGLRA